MNLGKLLQIYRDAPPERREEALLAALRESQTEILQPRINCHLNQAGDGACTATATYANHSYPSV